MLSEKREAKPQLAIDIVFMYFINNAYMESQYQAVMYPLEQPFHNEFLKKREELRSMAMEFELIFKGDIALRYSDFLRDYEKTLSVMYQYQIIIKKINEENSKCPRSLEELSQRFSEKKYRDSLYEALDKLREAAFFESVRVLVGRLMNAGTGKKISLPEINARINQLLKQSIKSDGVINLFSDVKEEFSLFDPKFLEEISKMKEKNLAVELLKKLIAEQVHIYKRTNVVKSEKFSELIHEAMNRYLNGMLTNEQVIEELLNLRMSVLGGNLQKL